MNSLAIILQSTDLFYSSFLLPLWLIRTKLTTYTRCWPFLLKFKMNNQCWSLNSNKQSGGRVVLLENILNQEMTHAIVHISDLFSLLSFIQRKQTTSIRSKYKTNSRRLDSDLELGDYSLELHCLLHSYKLVLSFKASGSNPVTCSLVQIMRSKNLALIIPSSCGAVYYANC